MFLVTHAAEARWEVMVVDRDGGAMTAFGGFGTLNERALTRVQAIRWTDAAWHGALPRALPLVVGNINVDEPVVVDLDARRVTRLATASPRWKLAGITRFGAGHALIVGRWIVGLDGDGRVIAAKKTDDPFVGPQMTDGHAIAWVDADGQPNVFRDTTVEQAVTGATARDEARRELGLELN